MSEEIPKDQINILMHSLGLNYSKKAYRNHFVTGVGSKDYDNCESLASKGLMTKQQAPFNKNHNEFLYCVTDSGKSVAIANIPKPKKLTKAQQNYCDFRHSDCGYSFSEWLGIDVPQIDMRFSHGGKRYHYDYRYYKKVYIEIIGTYEHVYGEWRNTKRAAKESYKEALKKFWARLKEIKEGVKGG